MTDELKFRDAFQNVACNADPTWSGEEDAYQKANMALYLRERQAQVQATRWVKLSPRTVRDSIPESRLALYANFEYDEARELSYAPATTRFQRLYSRFASDTNKEPWMLREIDDLLLGFLTYRNSNQEAKDCGENHQDLPCSNTCCELSYESPSLKAHTFEEMAMKFKITSKCLRRLWDVQFFPYFGWHPCTHTKTLNMFKSPVEQMFGSTLTQIDTYGCLETAQECDWSFTQLKGLSQSLKDQNSWIFQRQNSWLESTKGDPVDISTNKRLYSAVLQGTGTNARRNTSVQFPTVRAWDISHTTDAGTDMSARSPVASSEHQRKASEGCYRFQTSCTSHFHQRINASPGPLFGGYQCLPTNSSGGLFSRPLFLPAAGMLNIRHTAYFPQLVLQNPAPYAPIPFMGYGRPMLFPHRPPMVIPPSNWFLQQSVKTSVGLLATRNSPVGAQYRQPIKPKEEPSDFENIVAKTANAVLDDQDSFVPVTDSVSDDLELQALEQYSPSSDNMFSDLERQAAEQYDVSPENWFHPPKNDKIFFGGWRCLVTETRSTENASKEI